jgi:hypothetical protein
MLRADVYTATGKLKTSFDITAVPVDDRVDVLRRALKGNAKEARVVAHPEGQTKGKCIATVDLNTATQVVDGFPSRRAFGDRGW